MTTLTIVGLIVVVGSLAWWIADLTDRVKRLERIVCIIHENAEKTRLRRYKQRLAMRSQNSSYFHHPLQSGGL